jgi:signal transduction histidine kinase
MGVVEQTTSSATPRFKKVWKTQKCKKPDVDRWCRRLGDVSESINQLVAEASQDELGTLHEVKNVISSIFRIVEESLDKKYIGITFGDKLDIADPEWKKLYHATRQLENVLQLTDIVVNPAAASFGQPVRTAIYRTADSVVRTLEPKAQRLGHRLFIRGNSYRESQLYRSFPLIFFILVDNAIKYSNKGEDVIVEVNDTGGKVHVCVSSVGVPISDDEIDRIFDKNFRGTNTKGAAGSGVGLYVAQRIAAANGFKIWYESSPYPSESDAGLNEFMFTVP